MSFRVVKPLHRNKQLNKYGIQIKRVDRRPNKTRKFSTRKKDTRFLTTFFLEKQPLSYYKDFLGMEENEAVELKRISRNISRCILNDRFGTVSFNKVISKVALTPEQIITLYNNVKSLEVGKVYHISDKVRIEDVAKVGVAGYTIFHLLLYMVDGLKVYSCNYSHSLGFPTISTDLECADWYIARRPY